MAGIMRVLLGALPFLLPTFFFLSFFYDLLLPRVGAHAFPPPPLLDTRIVRSRPSIKVEFISLLFLRAFTCVQRQSLSVKVSNFNRARSQIPFLDRLYIYIYRFVFRNRILLSTKYSPIYLIFTFYSRIDDLKKLREEDGSLSIIHYLARVIG